ncbi:MAG: hypothetical protein R2867_18010 [Caldilineaceae bacterium]
MRPLIDACATAIYHEVGPSIFDKAFAAGQQMTLAEAFTTILDGSPKTAI